ncbi:uncharacterized protein LOC141685225 [Apium graveolens]|uniref:uncharacterized protein LOC141685225 n=1 Tax=Apium graveolens TaxID=4045 RepID=UPI003D78DEC6
MASYWIDPIKSHLETGWLPDDAQEARKLSVRALRYSLIEGLLYKRSFVIPYLKCLRPLKAEEALKEAHEGICGQNLGGRALAHKITRLGFYWPTMLADAKAYVKRRDRCQRNPFMLAYGAEAVVPLEITHGSPRIEAYEPETNEEGMRLTLDLIDEVRDEANSRNAEHQ